MNTSPTWHNGLDHPPGPVLKVYRRTSIARVWIGGNLEDDVFTVTNVGLGCLTYTLQDNVELAECRSHAGSSCGEADPITIHYNVSGLHAGSILPPSRELSEAVTGRRPWS